MRELSEYARRCKAIDLLRRGQSFSAVARVLQRCRAWVAKWWARYRREGRGGLHDRSRRPRRIRRRTAAALVSLILRIRGELVAHRTRRTAFAGRGAEAIRWELEQRHVRRLPSLRTIERLLQRHGCTRRERRRRRGRGRPCPAPRATAGGAVQQTDLVGPRHVRGPRGLTRFFAFHTLDLSRAVAASYTGAKGTEAFCAHFLHAWAVLGVPRVSQVDNELTLVGGNPSSCTFSQVLRLGLLLGVHQWFIPPGEPGRNPDIESFNGLWQARVLWRHACPNFPAVRRTSGRFLGYDHTRKPHRALRVATHGSRFLGDVLAAAIARRQPPPPGFTLDQYREPRGRLALPLARGRLSFVRRVSEAGTIALPGGAYRIGRRVAGQQVVATLYTHREELVVKLGGRVLKRLPCPIPEPVVAPLSPLPRGRG